MSVHVIDNRGAAEKRLCEMTVQVSAQSKSASQSLHRTYFQAHVGGTAKIWASTPRPHNPRHRCAVRRVPIKAGNGVIGAIGISGAPDGDKEMACANAGISRMADKLK